MLVLVFYLGEEKYMLKHDKVREISPMVVLKKMSHSPDYFAGFFNYRGQVVPVIDLCQLIQGYPCKMRLSTRIILVNDENTSSTAAIFGLVAERVTEAVKKPPSTFISPGIPLQHSPYLEGFMIEQDQMIPCLNLTALANWLHLQPLLEPSTDYVSSHD